MGNKFLELYPQLWEPQIGDQVCIIHVINPFTFMKSKTKRNLIYYKIGDMGKIVAKDISCFNIYFNKYQTSFWAYKEEFIPYHE